MTLTVSLTGADGVVAATDSRGTFGDPRAVTAQNDTMQKLYDVSSHVVVTVAGTAELGSQLMLQLQSEIGGRGLDGVTPVMDLVREQTRARFAEWFPGWQVQQSQQPVPPVRPDLAMIVTGYDRVEDRFGEPKTYQLLAGYDFAPMLSGHGFALQGVPQYALYLLNRLYVPEATTEELMALAAYVITETASQDGKVGGPVQMACIRPTEGCRILAETEIEEVISSNAKRSERLRASFFATSGTKRPARRPRRTAAST